MEQTFSWQTRWLLTKRNDFLKLLGIVSESSNVYTLLAPAPIQAMYFSSITKIRFKLHTLTHPNPSVTFLITKSDLKYFYQIWSGLGNGDHDVVNSYFVWYNCMWKYNNSCCKRKTLLIHSEGNKREDCFMPPLKTWSNIKSRWLSQPIDTSGFKTWFRRKWRMSHHDEWKGTPPSHVLPMMRWIPTFTNSHMRWSSTRWPACGVQWAGTEDVSWQCSLIDQKNHDNWFHYYKIKRISSRPTNQ